MNVGKIRLFAALVALVALAGAIGYGTRTAQAAAVTITGTKTCTVAGTVATCSLTLNFSPATTANATTNNVTISPSVGTYTSAAVTANTGCAAPPTVSGTTSLTLVLGGGAGTGGCTSVTISETLTVPAGTTSITQTAAFTAGSADTGGPVAITWGITGASATKTCTATGPASASCTFTVSFTPPPPVGITTVTVSLTSPTGATLALTSASLTPSTCGIATVAGNVVTINATAATCTSVAITETVTGLPINAASTISQSATLAGGVVGTATASAAVTTALGMSITCASTPGAPGITAFNTFLPATPTAPSIVAVGVVPATVACAVNLTSLDPGVVEISSVNGLLVSSSGTLTTNLRVSCGTSGVAGSCNGAIAFAVASGGVGFVTVQARYEPSPLSTTTERETSAVIAFVAPPVIMSLSLNPSPVAVNATGTATATFFVAVSCGGGAAPATPTTTILIPAGACVDVTTGAVITAVPSSSVLNGTVLFSIDNTAIARWTGAPVSGSPITAPPAASPAATGFTTSPNQVAVRCGFFSTGTGTTNAFGNSVAGIFLPFPGSLSQFFGGCTSVQAQYIGVAPGTATVSAQFIPDLPGALANVPFLTTSSTAPVNPLFGFIGAGNIVSTRTLEVTGAAPSGKVDLTRGCNNVSPTVTEAAADYAKRISPSGALVAIWEHQAATNTFRGWSPQAGAPNDLAQVTRLRPIFICVSGSATLDQPAA